MESFLDGNFSSCFVFFLRCFASRQHWDEDEATTTMVLLICTEWAVLFLCTLTVMVKNCSAVSMFVYEFHLSFGTLWREINVLQKKTANYSKRIKSIKIVSSSGANWESSFSKVAA